MYSPENNLYLTIDATRNNIYVIFKCIKKIFLLQAKCSSVVQLNFLSASPMFWLNRLNIKAFVLDLYENK